MQKHISLLGALHIANGLLGLIPATIIFMALVGGGVLSGLPEVALLTSTIGIAIGSYVAILSLPGIIGGYYVMQYREWARIVVLVVGVLELFNVPFGTALGAYTIWVVFQEETATLFRTSA